MKKLTISICLFFTLLFVAGCSGEATVPVTTMPPETTAVPTTASPTAVPETGEPPLYTPAEGSILNKIPYYGDAGAVKIRTLSHDGTYAKQLSLSDTVTTKDMLGGGEMLMFSKVKDDSGLIAYRDALASWGYTLYAKNVMLKCQYDTWVSDDTVVTLMYMPEYKRLHIIAEPMRALPARQQDNQYTDLGIENKIIMVSCHFMNQHNGACSIFQLCDGSFLIVDSGQGWHQRNTAKYKDHFQNNAKEIYHVLEQYSPDRDGDGDKDKDDIDEGQAVSSTKTGELLLRMSPQKAQALTEVLTVVFFIVEHVQKNGYTVSTMSDAARNFIANWESEKYRSTLNEKK
jgi:hypothetical protein